jgi:predicted transcriptional regulator
MKAKIWTSIRLEAENFKKLKSFARQIGSSRSEIMRRALSLGLRKILQVRKGNEK